LSEDSLLKDKERLALCLPFLLSRKTSLWLLLRRVVRFLTLALRLSRVLEESLSILEEESFSFDNFLEVLLRGDLLLLCGDRLLLPVDLPFLAVDPCVSDTA
jgi:hypothetical protein